MSHREVLVALLTMCGVLIGIATVDAQQALRLEVSSGSPIQGLGSATVEARLDSTDPTEGYVLALCHDANITVDMVSTAGTVSDAAEMIVPEVLAGGVTLGVVLDAASPFDGQTIPAGMNLLLAEFTVSSQVIIPEGDPDIASGLTFCDGILNSPVLDNIIVQGGLSYGALNGLTLDDSGGALTITAPPPDSLTIESASADADGDGTTGCARIILNNSSGDVQGFVLSISHDSGVLTLEDVNIDGTITDDLMAEFVSPSIEVGGGTLGVVLDFNSPFDGQVIATALDNHIANFCYSCNDSLIYFTGEVAPPAVVSDLTFVDAVFGSPPLSNVIVVAGLSLSPGLVNGTFTCLPVEKPLEDNTFYCGPSSYENTVDPASNPAPPIPGSTTEVVEVCFLYTDEDDALQGVQLSVCYDCNLTILSFDLAGSIFEEVGAEFVSYQVDDDDTDGDGCEFLLGILLDALPPFENQTVPPTAVPLIIGCAQVQIDDTAACGAFLSIDFCDGLNGVGSVNIDNLAIIDFEAVRGSEIGCAVEVVPHEIFVRGDCNDDDKVDLADAAKVLGWQFAGEPIACPDACDANDDGKINLADAVLIMNYLFLFGDPPPDPGPVDGMEGPDPTEDSLSECMSDDISC